MTCQSCGHEIADNAIVCYRCGTPTAIPASARPSASKPPSGGTRNFMLLLIVVAIIAIVLALKFGWHLL